MINFVHAFFTNITAPVFLPVIIFIICKVLKMSTKKAFLSGLYAGIGLEGFMLLIGAFTPIITPVVKQMVDSTGINLPIIDLGWQTASIIAYSSQIGLVFFVFAIVFQTVLFLVRWTDVFLPSDLWLNFSYMVWGTMLYVATNNFILAFAFMIVINLYNILNFEVLSNRWSKYYKYPNCTIISMHNTEPTILLLAIDPLFNLLKLNKVNLNPTTLKEKLGVLGEPATLGLLLGLFIGILGNMNRLDTLVAWGQITKLGIVLAALMLIFPKVAGIFGQAFAPMAEVTNKSMLKEKDKKDEKKSSRKWFIGVDDSTGYGETCTLITGTLLIPIMVFMALILPGNKTLPMVDLISLPFMIESIVAMTNGNMLKVIITATIWYSAGLYICTYTAPMYTHAAEIVGVALPTAALMITSFNIMAQPIVGLIFFAFLSQSPMWIALTIVVYFILFFIVKTKKKQIHAYIERQAAKNIRMNNDYNLGNTI
ncbi:PTS transporter subunit IIC [Paraclostridium bifermentans]|uniref:PTS transporter subunit IIC n=1 Tax=Paraclostridium bifermentans TaxID=1490 RepID=UPI00242E020F|nr:PTS transporter subunit IIC [Paraclostridium bifermentans]